VSIFKGIVQSGTKRAAALGFPTVNIPLNDRSISGIYAARVYVQDEAPYMAAVFADKKRKLLEAYLLDFSDNLYGLEVKIELHKKIREEREFHDEASLREAIAGDVKAVREYFHL
jgi:riboflavin kinase/FMN adenylyltransferase